ncbi:E3 ubiquitin ligase BIG BROTHER-related -like protein [Gossypium arboreum]|uniref:E3 ubiquitin ligase BIG BROTHER-related-like protein n=1 Tax=Gossypium arboreum TaxID=29729 RepID=A0A0B0N585_GOSAR|nr:E3 ubiquitin ligase BIG BROTHER-related -like protein [Gossypium arboreum]
MSAEQKEQVPNPNVNDNDNLNSESKQEERQSSTRTPFTNLSQVDADLALARTLQEQDAEEREVAARLLALAGINDRGTVTLEDHGHGGNSQDTWEEVDPDELSYEELLALAEVVGTESRGLSADSIASLPSLIYKAGNSQTGTNDSCVICRVDYEDGDSLTALSCKHSYHPECINNWLKINKVCPVCSAEVST